MITSRRTKRFVLIDLVLGFLLVAAAMRSSVALKKYKPCVAPGGKPGRCVHVLQCKALIERFRNPPPPPQDDQEDFLQGSICGHSDGSSLICCAVLLPQPPSCGRNASEPQFGVQATRIGEFPWTALIEYERSNGHLGYHCAGTLINQRYVLTAANCVSDIPRCWRVHRVRLGEWDFSTSDACFSGNSASWPIDMGIERIDPHGEYNRWDERQANDIALIRLASDVQYTAHIQPVCLPFQKTTDLVAYTVGWGITAKGVATHEKMMTHLTVLNKEEWLSVYKCFHITAGQMCARAVSAVQQTGTCDPGGQLLRYHDNEYYLIGIGSYGLENCGTGDSPVVYTKVAEYIDWIENTIF